MLTIPVITDNHAFAETVCTILSTPAGGHRDVWRGVPIYDAATALDYFNMEMPDLACIDFSSEAVNPFLLLDTIIGDPWLLHTGIIAFCSSPDEEENLGDLKKVNIIDTILHSQTELVLPNITGIIANNRQILFQRVFGTDLQRNVSAAIQLDNDLHAVSSIANLLANFLYNTNRLDREGKAGLSMVLNELLTNAVEHGNCQISYDDKTICMEQGKDIEELIRDRCENTHISQRTVSLEYTISDLSSLFKITDQGDGFNWKAIPDPTTEENAFSLHGRGILMARSFSHNLHFNSKGNEVAFEIVHTQSETRVMPGIFQNIEPTVVSPGEIILNEGEQSDYIYYIVNGSFEILVGNQPVSTLSEEDLFLGEMSFLLERRRTATVKATSEGRLIKVNKREFVAAIKQKPHYALLLARLLAQRIERFNASQVDKL